MLQITLYPETHTYNITKAETDGKYAMLEIASLSGNGSLLHSHSKEAEVFYVIDGEFLFQYREWDYNNKVVVVKSGTLLHLKKDR